MFELKPSTSKPGAVEIYWFQAYPLRSGVGTRAMQALQAKAQEHGVALTLVPWDKGRVSQAALTKFYKRQGFKPNIKGGRSLGWEPSLDEGLRDWVAALAATGAMALGTPLCPRVDSSV